MTVGELVRELLLLNQSKEVIVACSDLIGSPLKTIGEAKYKADSGTCGLVAYESDKDAIAEETQLANIYEHLPEVCVLYPEGFHFPHLSVLTPKEKSNKEA